jgi:hypothetical protein
MPTPCSIVRQAQDERHRWTRQEVMALLDESLAIPRELGMRTLLERVLARREILRVRG